MLVSQPLKARKDVEDTWLTPPELIKALGPFDLDPCTPAQMPWETAAARYTPEQDGLHQPWTGRVWLNPPYGPRAIRWMAKLAHHGDGIALLFARTDTEMFFETVWGKADAILFIRGRLFFHHEDGTRAKANSGGPNVLVAYGKRNVSALRTSNIEGYLVEIK